METGKVSMGYRRAVLIGLLLVSMALIYGRLVDASSLASARSQTPTAKGEKLADQSPRFNVQALNSEAQFQKGMNYAAWWQGLYQTPEADQSLENLASTGTEWLSLVVTG